MGGRAPTALAVCLGMAVAWPAAAQTAPEQTAPAPQATPSMDDIFQKVFKRQPPPLADARYPIIIEGANVGDALISRPDKPAETTVERQPLLAALEDLLRPDLLRTLAETPSADHALRLGELRAVGIGAEFDRTTLSLRIRVPLELQTRRGLAVLPGRQRPSVAGALAPAGFSAWLNMAVTSSYVQESEAADDEGRAPMGAQLAGSFHLSQWALDYAMSYAEDDSPRWQRGDVTLVHDWTEQAIRARLGDVYAPARGFQASPSMAGLSVARDFRLQPYTVFQPVGQQEFDVDQSSRVQVFVNGAFVREMRVTPGRYNMRNLPLTDGFGNDVEVRIINDAGDVRTLRSRAFFDYDLLASGVAEYGVSGGVPQTFEDGDRDYDQDHPFGSGFFRYGVNEAATLGTNLQSGDGQNLFGTEALVATGIGSFLGHAAASFGGSQGGSGLLQYHASIPELTRSGTSVYDLEQTIDLSALYQSPGFKVPSLVDVESSRWSFLGRYSQELDEDRRFQVGVERDIGGTADDVTGASISVSQRFGLGSATLGVQAQRREGEHEEGVWLSFTLPLGPGSLFGTVDSRDSSMRAMYSRPPSPGVGGLGYSVGYSRTDDGDDAIGDVTYTGNRFEASASQQASALVNGTGRDVRTVAALSTALVFANGRLALSRPVRDSFLIVDTHPAVKDVDIAVDPHRPFGTDRYYAMAESDLLGPAVLPDLNSYFVRDVAIEAPGAPPGISLGNDVIRVNPTYHSGTVVQVGGAGNVSAVVTLLRPDGTPFGNVALHPLDGPEGQSFFTNKTGRAFLEKLEPGKTYQFRVVDEGKRYVAKVSIPADTYGLYRAAAPITATPSP